MSDHTQVEFARLVWKTGETENEKFITQEGITIGRSSQNNLVIDDLAASRFHCKVLRDEAGFVLIDLESTNGTFLNDSRVTENASLTNGDQIRIGKQIFKIQIAYTELAGQTLIEEKFELPLEETRIVSEDSGVPWLIVSSGTGKGSTFNLSKKRMQIGRASRDKQWDIDLVDRSVSRPHAEIVQEKDAWVLVDLGSINGTTLNGVRVTGQQALKDGDVIGFGETLLVFRVKGKD